MLETTVEMASRHRAAPWIDPRFCCFALRIARSRIHRWGVFTCEPIPARRKVIEYTGERITRAEAVQRLCRPTGRYVFKLAPRRFLDGRVGGSGAEYLNHSCDGCLYSCRRRGHILLMSRRAIRRGEELNYDYHLDPAVRRIVCHCGAKKCRGTLNLKARVKRG